jgi:hypothetical protein
MRGDRFHGRHENTGRTCEHPDCQEEGAFRAPGHRGNSFDGPGDWRWLCLDHVRAFNAGYDFFDGMSADEIFDAQQPVSGWDSRTRAFTGMGADGLPRWADFTDPLDAIGARAEEIRGRARRTAQSMRAARANNRFNREEVHALDVLGLGRDVDRRALRRRYGELVRRYHPDRNGGDRTHETRLNRVVDAYKLLRESAALA